MVEHLNEYVNLFTTHNRYTQFFISVIHHVDVSYLEEMDEWDPYSEISMFNNLDGYGNKLDIMTKRDVCYEFEKLMTRYIYLEKVVNEYKTEKKKTKENFCVINKCANCNVFRVLCGLYIYPKCKSIVARIY